MGWARWKSKPRGGAVTAPIQMEQESHRVCDCAQELRWGEHRRPRSSLGGRAVGGDDDGGCWRERAQGRGSGSLRNKSGLAM